MADLNFPSKKNKDKKRLQKTSNVDLTPMVDLGFLLITFFVITTTMQEYKEMNLVLPKDSTDSSMLNASTTLTIILRGNDSINYYDGSVIEIKPAGFGSIRKIIQQKQSGLIKNNIEKAKLTLIIKPSIESSYKNFINALDEVSINDVRHYFVADPKKEEL